jgi:O-antigen ligase
VATVIVPTLQGLVLSWQAAPGGRVLQIGLDGGTLGFVLSAGLLTVTGWAMREAARLKAENEGFV